MILGSIIKNMVISCSSTILCGNCGRIIDPKEAEMPCIEWSLGPGKNIDLTPFLSI